jgi:hypothetical protein
MSSEPEVSLTISLADPVPFDPGIRDGFKKIKIRIRDEHPRSCFREFRTIVGLKYQTPFKAVKVK